MDTKRICQYGEDCYRKNPSHFKDFSHPHLERILDIGKDEKTCKYEIPDELFLSKEIVYAQLEILKTIYVPKIKVVKKIEKTEKEEIEKNRQKHIQGLSNESEPNLTSSNISLNAPSTSNDVASVKNNADNNKRSSFGELNENSSNLSNTTFNTPSTSNNITSVKTNADNSKRLGVGELNGNSSNLSKKLKMSKDVEDFLKIIRPKGQMAKKLENAAPYNFFLTGITDSKLTHSEPLSITFQEILDDSLGELESSLQINFMVDVGWLLTHYYIAGCGETPLLILYGDETPELKNISKFKPHVTALKVNMSTPFSTHHTKMMLLGYKDGSMRVVISTANLYADDWHNRTQGLWISPKLEKLPENVDTKAGESNTNFRNDLMLYLDSYKISKLTQWIARIRVSDFSSINVFLVASSPGGHRESPNRGFPFGHARLGFLLGKNSAKIDETCPIVAQSSSIGSLGNNIQSWIQQDFSNSLRKDSTPMGVRRLPRFKMIYPSFNNVTNSHDGMLGGGCLPYSKNTNDKQLWLRDHLYQWQSNSRYRSQAMPHIKTYCRWSDEGLYWFCLTSANISKAAWGIFNKNVKIVPTLRVNNYEAGVLFLPRFVTGEDTFPLDQDRDGVPKFPMPYDIPLKPYGFDDQLFVMDYLMQMMNESS